VGWGDWERKWDLGKGKRGGLANANLQINGLDLAMAREHVEYSITSRRSIGDH